MPVQTPFQTRSTPPRTPANRSGRPLKRPARRVRRAMLAGAAAIVTASIITVSTGAALAKDTSYRGSVHVVPANAEAGTGAAPDAVRGTVFLDANRNSVLDEGESGVAGVKVSNGREVVLTNDDGSYELPAYGDMNVFMTKPAGHAVPVNDLMVPQFAYVHKEEGSPPLRYGGIEPTGALPGAINFPVIEDPAEDATFKAQAFGDVQAYSNRELGYTRETLGRMLATRDLTDVEFLIFEGDVIGDDLALYPRLQRIMATGATPHYWVAGNHDLDFDAEDDAHSFDTFRTQWGPEYYSFDVGEVHVVVLDNVRYPCNGVDPHPFCGTGEEPTYNGVVSERQIEWLANDLANVPEDKLILLNAHIPFQTYTDNTAAKHQTDNLAELAAVLDGREVLALAGHTHTTENILPGESFEGWEENTGLAKAPFHQIITGGVSGSWWAGDLGEDGVPHGTQRLGAPRGFYELSFDGSNYTDTYVRFGGTDDEQLHVSFNTPRFREWAGKLIGYVKLYDPLSDDAIPPVTVSDLGDMNMVTRADLEGGEGLGNDLGNDLGTWAAVNVWNGSADTDVSVSINGGEPIAATRIQDGAGEAKLRGPEYADPLALSKQATQGRTAFTSAQGGEETAGYETWQGTEWVTERPAPFPGWMLATASPHLWRADLPADLPEGVHALTATATDPHGRTFETTIAFEVVDEVPQLDWNEERFTIDAMATGSIE